MKATVLILMTFVSSVSSQTIIDNLWTTNGPVNAIQRVGDTIYVGGDFFNVGPSTGPGVALNTTTAQYDPQYPKVNGIILAVASDGAGGWFIGGIFFGVGAVPIFNLAHIRPDKTVDPNWNPAPDGAVYSLLLDGTTLYVGGQFTTLGGQPRRSCGALSASTGQVQPWNPDVNGFIFAMAVTPTTVFLGGFFDSVSASPYQSLVEVTKTGGLPTGWDRPVNGIVNVLTVSGQLLYVGGGFDMIDRTIRQNLAAVTIGGSVTPWNPMADGAVADIIVSSGTVFLGGDFLTIGQVPRSNLASVTESGGSVLPWNPSPDQVVHDLELSGTSIYLSGEFTTVAGVTRNGLARVDISSGVADGWNPNCNSAVYRSVLSGSTLYAGGFFTSVNGVDRERLAAFNANTGIATNWNPGADGPVQDLLVINNTVYVGGAFSTLGGIQRSLLGAVNATTGVTTAWNPLLFGYSVYAMKPFGSQLLVGGDFSQVGQAQRNSAAGIDLSTALPTLWDPNVTGVVNGIEIQGSRAYLGGNFDVLGGAVRNFLAAVTLTDGAVLPWNPSPDQPVNSIIANGSSVFVGGSFNMVGNFPRTLLAEIDTGGTIQPWSPSFFVSGEEKISTMALSGTNLYVGGDFSEVDLQPRLNLVAFDMPARSLSQWAPFTDLPVNELIRQDSIVYIGGQFFYVGGSISTFGFQVRSGFAGLADQSLVPSISVISPNGGEVWLQGTTQQITWSSNNVPGNVNIDITFDDGLTYTPIVINNPNSGVYPWRVNGPATLDAYVRVSSTSNPSIRDESDGTFTIGGASFIASPDSLNFGPVAVGSSSQLNMVVRNQGSALLTISSIISPTPFSINPVNASIAPGDSATFTVQFSPLTATPYVEYLLFNHDGTGSPSAYLVQGIGATAGFTAIPPFIAFGVVQVDSTKSDTVRVTNTGASPLDISSVTPTGAEFSVSPSSITIAPATTVPFVVSFTPPSPDIFVGSIVFAHNGPSGTDSVLVSGTGASPQVLFSPVTVMFGNLQVGSRIGAPISAVNIGTLDLRVTSVAISGLDSTEFRIAGGTGPFPPVTPGDSIQFQLEFEPTSIGPKSSRLMLVSNALSSPDFVPLIGNAIGSPIQPLVVGDTTIGNALGLRVTLPANFTLTSDSLYFRNGGQTSYQVTNFQRSGNTLDVTIPSQYVNIRGVEFYLALRGDSSGVPQLLTFPDVNPALNPAILRIRVSAAIAALPVRPSKYQMVSAPLELNNPQSAAVLVDDYGPYQTSVWRLFRWENAAYSEYQQIQADFRGGNSFWLITASGAPFSAQNGLSTDSRSGYAINVPPGFSQISNPFAFPVAWDSVTNSSLLNGLIGYDGDQYVPGVQLMQPWQGYFAYNPGASTVNLTVPAVQSPPVLGKIFSMTDYAVQFAGRIPGTEFVDTYNYVGFIQGAEEQEDRKDLREPPAIHQELVISVVDDSRRYLANFKPFSSSGARWDIEVRSSMVGRPITCQMTDHGVIPDGFRIFVIDRDNEESIADPTRDFSATVPASGAVRRFTVIIGTEEYARQNADGVPLAPISYALEQNYPNPFNPSTNIRFQLAKKTYVTLEVFDLLGRRIATLVDGERSPGTHMVEWNGLDDNGTPASTGVYLYRLRTGEFVSARKLVLLR